MSVAGGDMREKVVAELAERLRRGIGQSNVLTHRQEFRTYECDGLAAYTVVPIFVAPPETAERVRAVVRSWVEADVPYVARDAGTGLSGGGLPHPDGVLVLTSRLRRILDIDIANQRAVLEPAVANLRKDLPHPRALSRRAPSSQGE